MCYLNALYMEKKEEDGEGCKGFERWYGGIWNNKTIPCEKWKKIEKETMRYMRVMWYSMQRHERWRDCGLEWYVTVCMIMRKRMEWLIMERCESSLLTYISLVIKKFISTFIFDIAPSNLFCVLGARFTWPNPISPFQYVYRLVEE